MKKFQQLLSERKGEKAHREAVAMGLKYKGFGYWVDPSSGKVTHKTENDQLVEVEPDVESEKAQPGMEAPRDAGPQGGLPGAKEGLPQGGPMGLNALGAKAGMSVLGAPEPGQEQAPRDLSWEPGPDGDNNITGDTQKIGVPQDTFVGKTNYYNWTAGPDGSSAASLELGAMREWIEKFTEDTQGNLPLTGAGYQEKNPTNVAKQRMARVMGKAPIRSDDVTDDDARIAINKMRDNPQMQTVLGNQIAAMRKIANRSADRSYDSAPKDMSGKARVERNKEADMRKQIAKIPSILKDKEAVQMMNDEAKKFVSDPNYDLDKALDEDDFLDGGAFGQVYFDGENVIKKGDLGPKELAALHAMRNNPQFPTLINARFDGPFKHKSSEYNNPGGLSPRLGGSKASGYWDPDEESDFDRKFPSAPGTYAMTKAKGRPLADAIYDMDEEQKEKMMRSFWRARGAMHKAGFSHNDMHGGNVFVDDDGEANIIDLGLANDDPLSALMEGLGGMDYEQGEDYQLAGAVRGSALPERLRRTFDNNRSAVEEMLLDSMDGEGPTDYDDYDEDQDYSPTYQGAFDRIQDFMRGGIRQNRTDLQALREDIPFLQKPENVQKLIKALYDEVGQSELADRMSDAFDKRQQDSRVIRTANAIRKRRGESPIEVTNKSVVPPQNLDFDD